MKEGDVEMEGREGGRKEEKTDRRRTDAERTDGRTDRGQEVRPTDRPTAVRTYPLPGRGSNALRISIHT